MRGVGITFSCAIKRSIHFAVKRWIIQLAIHDNRGIRTLALSDQINHDGLILAP